MKQGSRPVRIARSTARRLAIAAQGLDGGWRLPKAKEGAAQAMERLGFLQIDTIAVVERAHHHQLWSRCPDYNPDMLDALQSVDRRVFEGWTHAASYIPMRDYRYYAPNVRAFAESPKAQAWFAANAQVVDEVLGRIGDEGALGAADFKAPEGFKRGDWWHWKPAKQALEHLFSAGRLMVSERRAFHRRYDLTERVLPADLDVSEPTPEERNRFLLKGLLARTGLLQPRGAWWQRHAEAGIRELVDAGEVVEVHVTGLDGHTYYASPGSLDAARKKSRRRPRVHILSPFDQLVTHRPRTDQIFGFEQRLEAYLPAAKRKYGYFCLPILWGEELVGRLDAKAERKAEVLVVRKLFLESGLDGDDSLLPELARTLRAFAVFNGCQEVAIEDTLPRKVRAPLRRELR